MNILLAAANSGVGNTLGAELVSRGHNLISISRADAPDWSNLHLMADLSVDDGIGAVERWLAENDVRPDTVIQCAGVLHRENNGPEKMLMQITEAWLQENISANLMAHIRLAQALNSLVSRRTPLKWVSLSAMVGSISDNQLGGWHSYRMSKAALNMFVRNLHIEWSRKSPDSVAVALHPGTTDTALSKPFQANIRDGKLYSAELTARRLADVVENLSPEQSGKLLHWDGSVIPF